jgi:hypothetical protein
MDNLDLLAAEAAGAIVRDTIGAGGRRATDVENLATKALGVLQENGPYAAMLFLYSRPDTEEKIARPIREQLLDVAARTLRIGIVGHEVDKALESVARLAADLEFLLLLKQLWEQTLIYTRYGAKAHKE